MQTQSVYITIIGLIFITLALIAAHPYLPEHTFNVEDNEVLGAFLASSESSTGGNVGEWGDEAMRAYNCDIKPYRDKEPVLCTFGLSLGFTETDDTDEGVTTARSTPSKGVDLSEYSSLEIGLNYTGPSDYLRVYFRNFNALYASAYDANSSKFMSVIINTSQTNQKLVIPLSDAAVADWWLAQYNIPDELTDPEFSNVITVGIDFAESQPKPGNHQIAVTSLIFKKQLISQESLYLLLISFWLISAFLYACVQLVQLRIRTRDNAKVISRLSEENSTLEGETDELRRLSTVDPLTGAFNRLGAEHIVQELGESRAASIAKNFSYSIMVIDIDHFKRVNDTHGHAVGDTVLKELVAVVKTHLRHRDYITRWGGEEFVVFLPYMDETKAYERAEDIRRSVLSMFVVNESRRISVTVSIGLAQIHDDEGFQKCFERADEALYKAKSAGRNCTLAATEL